MESVSDLRRAPRIPTARIVRCAFVMIAARLGSLNALEQNFHRRFWEKFLDGPTPSADTIGRVVDLIPLEEVRALQKRTYAKFRRNKIPLGSIGGMWVLVLDGHESHVSSKRKCTCCLERTVKTAKGERKEYYHRHVLALLLTTYGGFLLDVEAQRSGENEVAAARRLLERTLAEHPRAFDIVVADALYAQAPFFNFLLDRGKHAMAVLKHKGRHLRVDAESLCAHSPCRSISGQKFRAKIWDVEGLETWEAVKTPVRVVRSVKRQLTGEEEEEERNWCWVTTAPSSRLSTEAVWEIGHARWCVENQGFNELVNHWHADHIYKHGESAILCLHLLTMLAYNLFHAFYYRNLKPAFRRLHSMIDIGRDMMSELYQGADAPVATRSP